MAKQKVGIEQLLQWAFGVELPQLSLVLGGDQWGAVSDYGAMGGVAIGWSSRPQRYARARPPHADAIRIGQVVKSLDAKIELHWTDFREKFMSDLIGITPTADMFVVDFRHETRSTVISRPSPRRRIVARAQRAAPIITEQRRTFSKPDLIIEHASSATYPNWRGAPRPFPCMTRQGKVAIVGKCKDKNRYTEGSLCELNWARPSVEDIALRRATYAVWWSALGEIVEALGDGLDAYQPVATPKPQMPWLEPEAPETAKTRILQAIEPPAPANDTGTNPVQEAC